MLSDSHHKADIKTHLFTGHYGVLVH